MKTTDQILKIKATVLYVLGHLPQGVDYIHLFKIPNFIVLNECIALLRDLESLDFSVSHGKAWFEAKRTADHTGEDSKIPLYNIADAGGASKVILSVVREYQWIERACA